MPKDAHNKAAEHHEKAATTHRTAAEHHGKGDHSKGHAPLQKNRIVPLLTGSITSLHARCSPLQSSGEIRAYFDYQREKAFIRTHPQFKLINHRGTTRTRNLPPKPDKTALVEADRCPGCRSRKLKRDSYGPAHGYLAHQPIRPPRVFSNSATRCSASIARFSAAFVLTAISSIAAATVVNKASRSAD